MLRKILKWLVYPGTPQSRERERFLREFEEKLPELIKYYEGRSHISKEDGDYVKRIIKDYREVYREAEASDRANVTLRQAKPLKNAQLEIDIISLENLVGGLE